RGGARARNRVAADRLREAVGRVRHVAVQAVAAARLGRVVRVRAPGRGLAERRMAGEARARAVLAGLELIRAPVVGDALFRGVHLVAREAGHLSLSGSALEAGRLDEAVVLAPRDAHLSVGPEVVRELDVRLAEE